MRLSVAVPSGHERGPQYAEQLFSALHGVCSRRQPVAMGFDCRNGTVGLFAEVPDELGPLFAERLADAFPDARVAARPSENPNEQSNGKIWQRELRPSAELFSLLTSEDFDHLLSRTFTDPLTGVLSAIRSPAGSTVRMRAKLILRPASPRRCRRAVRLAERVVALMERHRGLAMWLARFSGDRHLAVRMFGNMLCRTVGRSIATGRIVETMRSRLEGPMFEARLIIQATAPAGSQAEALARLRSLAAAYAPFSSPETHLLKGSVQDVAGVNPERGFLLSVAEVATLWHPPTEAVRVAALSRSPYRQLEPPAKLPSPAVNLDVAVLGRVDFRERREQFGLLPEDRRRHLAIVGKTGMGKSTLLSSLLISDMRAGHGTGLLDPHGDLAESLLAAIPSHRTNDVVLLDAGDRAFPVGYNPLSCPSPEQRPLVVSGIVAALKHLYADSWGPRLEHILRCALLTLVEIPDSSLISLMRLLSDSRYRRTAVAHVSDPVVRSFWQREFDAWRPQFQVEAVAPIQNKIGQFLSHPVLRDILGQPKSTLDLRRVIDEGKIFIANLSKGKIGEDGASLLGSLLLSGLQVAAMGRSEIAESKRRDYHLVVDEFQNFATESFATILSEARKFRLCLTLANQYLDQVPEPVRAALFGNVGSLLAFQVGAADAETLAAELGDGVTPQDLVGLQKYTAYVRLLVDGLSQPAFSMTTIPPVGTTNLHRIDLVRRTSRHRYARRAVQVEKDIASTFVA